MKKKIISIIVCLMILLYPAVNIVEILGSQVTAQSDENHSEVLLELDEADVHNAQDNINKTEALLQNSGDPEIEEEIIRLQNGETTFRKVFRDVCIVGDSLMNGLEAFDLLNSNNLITQVSASLYHLSDNIDKIVGMSPKVLILHYGINMLDLSDEQPGNFIKLYSALVQKLKDALPDTRIIVSGIFPVDTEVVRSARFGRIDEYNQALSDMCEKIGVEFLDNNFAEDECPDCYSSDGIHFNKKFYSEYWLIYIMREKGII